MGHKVSLEDYINLMFLHAKHNTVDDGNGNRQFCFCPDCDDYRMFQVTNQILADNPTLHLVPKMTDAEYEEAKQITLARYRERLTLVQEMQETLTRYDGVKELLALIKQHTAAGCDDPNCDDCKEQPPSVVDKMRKSSAYGKVSAEELEWRPGMYL